MMEKINNGHPQSQSPDFVAQNIATLKQLFPTIVKEGKIDMKELQALLGDEVETDDEYYRFTWAGKSMARREANKPSTATLRPDKASSKDWDTTQNVFIEGDNLEVLKLLQKSYANKIKMIYIDPPYNTGKDFVYKDNYNDNLGNYLAITGQVDEAGKRISTNSESDGRYHSNWLNMMYPRLKLARNLLKEDGLIFISIDDNEVFNLRIICNDVFGEWNSLTESPTTLIWKKSSSTAGHFSNAHEYMLVYAKNKKEVNYFELDDFGDNSIIEHSALKKISKSNPASKIVLKKGMRFEGTNAEFIGIIGASETMEILGTLIFENGKLKEDTEVIAGWAMKTQILSWMKGDETFDSKGQKVIEFFFNKSGLLRYRKERGTLHPKTILPDDIGSTKAGGNDLETIFEIRGLLDYPKPVSLLRYLLSFSMKMNDIVLDFFAGSGTTAHAVMQLNSEDGGDRKFICVQLPEPTDENSEANKAGYKTISAITKERIRRAGEKIKSALKEDLFTEQGKTLDIGFRAFKLDSSNISAWDGNTHSLEKNLFNEGKNIKENRTEEDVLYEILLKYGLDLTMPIEQKEIAGKQVFNIGMGALFICLGNNLSTAVAEGIGKWKEALQPATTKVIFKDTGFTDVDKTNSMQILKQFGIQEVNTI